MRRRFCLQDNVEIAILPETSLPSASDLLPPFQKCRDPLWRCNVDLHLASFQSLCAFHGCVLVSPYESVGTLHESSAHMGATLLLYTWSIASSIMDWP